MKIINLTEKPDCLEKICRWHHNEWGYLNPGRTFEARVEDMKENFLNHPIPATYVSLDDSEEVTGSASILQCDMPERSDLSPWLASVFVEASARKEGIGRALVKRVMQHARDIGVKTLYLYTPDREHFYRHMGWQTIEKLEYHGADVTLMRFVY